MKYKMDDEIRKLTMLKLPDKSVYRKAIMSFPLHWAKSIQDSFGKSYPGKEIFYNVFQMTVNKSKEFYLLDFFPSIKVDKDKDGQRSKDDFQSKLSEYFENAQINIIMEGGTSGVELPDNVIEIMSSLITTNKKAESEGSVKIAEFAELIGKMERVLNIDAYLKKFGMKDVKEIKERISEVPVNERREVQLMITAFGLFAGLKNKLLITAKELLDSFRIKLTNDQEKAIKDVVDKT